MTAQLTGRWIAILATDGNGTRRVQQPRKALEDAAPKVELISPEHR